MTSSDRPASVRERRLARLRRVAALMAPLCLAGAVLLPMAVALIVVRMPAVAIASHVGLGGLAVPEPSAWARGALVVLGTLPVGLLAVGLMHARRALACFAQGRFFTVEAVTGLRGLAAAAWMSGAASLVAPTVASVVLTWAQGPGDRRLAFTLGSGPLLQILTASLVWLLAGVLAEAQALADENAQFV